jgi:hypothetical protein
MLVVVALAAVFVVRSDTRGDGPSPNPKPGTESTAKPPDEATARPAMTDAGSTTETAVQHALAQPADFHFVDTPLKDVSDFIADHYKIGVLLDLKALTDAGITGDTAVTVVVKDVSLRSALHLMLRSHDLAWTENSPNVLMITTADVAKVLVVLKVYDVRKFAEPADELWGRFGKPAGSRAAGSPATGAGCGCQEAGSGPWDGLKQVIVSTVVPASWDENGGAGSLSIFDGDLIVSQTDDIQSMIADLLQTLEAARQQDPAALKAGVARSFLHPPRRTRVEHALDSSLDLDFTDTPLKDVIDYLEKKLGIPIQLDTKALTDAGITGDTALTFKLKNVAARVGIRDLLESKGMDFVIDHEVLLITVTDTATMKTVTELYPVGDLVGSPDFSALGKDPYDALTEAITTAVRPSSWDANGGPGSIAPFAVCKVLVVSQPEDGQREIQELLSSIRSVRRNLPDTAAGANNAPILRVYWLPWENAGSIADEKEGQQLVEMVRKLIAPKSWTDPNAYIGFIHGALVVRQTADIHRRIESFMGGLNDVQIGHAAAKTTPAVAPPAVNPPATTPPAITPPPVSPPPAAAPPSASSAVAPGTR